MNARIPQTQEELRQLFGTPEEFMTWLSREDAPFLITQKEAQDAAERYQRAYENAGALDGTPSPRPSPQGEGAKP